MAKHSTAFYLSDGASTRERSARRTSSSRSDASAGDPSLAYQGARRADDRRAVANRETRSGQFGAGWASATNPESGAQSRHAEREWGRA